MKRNMDLVRTILLKIEEYPEPNGWVDISIEGYTNLEISYHIKLLSQAKLIEAVDGDDTSGFDWRAISLTWEGHEFLDAAKNITVWEKTKALIKSKGLGESYEVVKFLLKEVTLLLIKEGIK